MSQDEHWFGKLKKIKVPKDFINLEQQIKYLETLGYEFEDVDLEEEWFYSSTCIKIKDDWYNIDAYQIDSYGADLIKIAEDEYYFSAFFYNGGTCLGEVLDDLIKKEIEEK